MQCQTCGLNLDPQQVAQTGRCPRCGTPVAPGAPSGASGAYGSVPTYGQAPTVGGPPPTYGPPPVAGGPPPDATFSTIAPPPQQSWGGPPPQPGYGAPPQPGYGGPPQPGYGAPPPGYGAPPKKRNTGLIVIISVIVLIVLAGGTVGAIALLGKKGNTTTNQGSGTPTATSILPTPTQPAVPTGFQTYTGSDFSIAYPADWQKSNDTSGGSGVAFIGPTGEDFTIVNLGASPLSPADIADAFCMGVGSTTAGPTTVTIGGQQWTREECANSDGTVKAVAEAIIHNGQGYLIGYASPTATFDSDQTQYFTPMEQSFTFLS